MSLQVQTSLPSDSNISSGSAAAEANNDNNGIAFPTNRIFVGNLASELEEFTIYKYCSAYGEITKCQIMKEPKTDKSRGFGFITYAQASSAQAILNARPHYIGHHKINVKPAYPTSEILVHNIAVQSSTNLPRTRRLFMAYNAEDAKRNDLEESAIFGFLSNYGVIKEIVQQFKTSSEEHKKNPVNDYWIVEYLDEASVDRCIAGGSIQYVSGVRLHLKRVVSEQDLLRRKRKLQEEEANRQAEMEKLEAQQPQFPSNAFFKPAQSLLTPYRPAHHHHNYHGFAKHSMSLRGPIPPPPPPVQSESSRPSTQIFGNKKAKADVPPRISATEDILKGYGYQ